MGFLRKTIILGTGGLAPIKSRSYRERTARATERQAKLLEQQMLTGAVAPGGTTATATPAMPWLVVFAYGEDRHQVDHILGVASGFVSEARAQRRAEGKKKIKTPSGRVEVTGFKVVKTDPAGLWQLTYDLDNGHTVAGDRFNSKEDAVLVGNASWKAKDPNKSYRTIKRCRVEPVTRTEDGAPPPATKNSDPVEQLRNIGELRDMGVLTSEEFEAKKADLLKRI